MASTIPKKKKMSLQRIIQNYWQLYVILIIPIVYIIIFSYVPMFGIQIAFKKFNYKLGIWGSPWVGFKNFEKFFTNYMFERIMVNTMRISFFNTLFSFPFPILFALCLNSVFHNRYKKTVQTITYMPHFISTVVVVGMLRQMVNPRLGIYGVIMKALTGTMPIDPFIVPGVFDLLYIGSGIWKSFGYSSIMYLAALVAVNPELHEAAQIDGATRFQRMLHVEIPCIAPTVIIMLIMSVGHLLGVGFEKVYLMQTTMNLQTSEVISTYVYKQSIGGGGVGQYGYSTAVSLFNNIVNIILLVIVNAISRKVSETSLW